MLTAIIVEDMPDALQLLQRDIEANHPEITISDTAQSVVEAAKLLRKNQPDILFLDIMLGDGTGFDILEIVPNLKSKIIFVTASVSPGPGTSAPGPGTTVLRIHLGSLGRSYPSGIPRS